MYLQWQITTESNTVTDYKNFPIAFPTECVFVCASHAPWVNYNVIASSVAWVGLYSNSQFLCGIGNNLSSATYENVMIYSIGY